MFLATLELEQDASASTLISGLKLPGLCNGEDCTDLCGNLNSYKETMAQNKECPAYILRSPCRRKKRKYKTKLEKINIIKLTFYDSE